MLSKCQKWISRYVFLYAFAYTNPGIYKVKSKIQRAAHNTRFLAVYSRQQLFYNTHYPGTFTQIILVTSVYSTICLPTLATKPIFVL